MSTKASDPANAADPVPNVTYRAVPSQAETHPYLPPVTVPTVCVEVPIVNVSPVIQVPLTS